MITAWRLYYLACAGVFLAVACVVEPRKVARAAREVFRV